MAFSSPRLRSWLTTLNDKRALNRLWVCVGVYVLLLVWAWQWRYTGDGDSMLHYWNLRVSWLEPKLGMTSWARPVYVLLMIVPAQFGWMAARCFAALIATLTAWQTMRMADDLKLPNATLSGLFLIFQPLAFSLASDTMTEIPMALGLAIALRLWWAKRFLASCLLMSFLPFVRPEGFLLAPVWGLFLLALPRTKEHPTWPQRILIGASLATGVVTLLIACRLVTGQWLYYVYAWSWPLVGAQKGSLWHHFIYWPYYCGVILLVLFLFGLWPSCKRAMGLAWASWLTVILAHSVMFWKGTFGAVGFMRILVTTAPVTALICLYGWNELARLVRAERWPVILQRAATVFVVLAAALTAMLHYALEPQHYRFVLAEKAASFVRANALLASAPRLFVSDPIVQVELDVSPRDVLLSVENLHHHTQELGQLVPNSLERDVNVRLFQSLPPGSIGVWENEQGRWWHQIAPDELPTLGYTVLFKTQQSEKEFLLHFTQWMHDHFLKSFVTLKNGLPQQEYVVVRKN